MNHHELSDHWTTNESLLQSYRSIFVASQALFISGAALTGDTWINIVIIAIAIFQLWIGYTVVNARAKIVDFYKYDLSRYDTELEKYLHNKGERRRVNNLAKIETNWRKTRTKIDVYMPLSFLLIWLCFLLKFFIDNGLFQNFC